MEWSWKMSKAPLRELRRMNRQNGKFVWPIRYNFLARNDTKRSRRSLFIITYCKSCIYAPVSPFAPCCMTVLILPQRLHLSLALLCTPPSSKLSSVCHSLQTESWDLRSDPTVQSVWSLIMLRMGCIKIVFEPYVSFVEMAKSFHGRGISPVTFVHTSELSTVRPNCYRYLI